MTRAIVGLMLMACGGMPSPPEEFSIDPSFTPEQASVLRDAIASWCDAVGWCPREVADSGERGRFVLAHDYDRVGESDSAYNDTYGNIFIDAQSPHLRDPETLWLIAAHEAGHWGINGHTKAPSLMSAAVRKGAPRVIDAASRETWCAQSGC